MRTCGMELSPHERTVIAARAGCDPRTVLSVVQGRPVRSTTLVRVQKAIDDFCVQRGAAGPEQAFAGSGCGAPMPSPACPQTAIEGGERASKKSK